MAAIFAIFSIYLLNKNRLQKLRTSQIVLEQKQKQADATIFELMLTQQQKISQTKQIEQNRVAQELHDSVTSQLEAIRLRFDIELNVKKSYEPAVYVDLLENFRTVILEIRGIAHDLNKNIFSNNIGFIAVVQELILQTQAHSKIKFELNISPSIDWSAIEDDYKLNLFRIIQEAFQNILKHSQAELVTLDITKTETMLKVCIADNGIGITSKNQKGIGVQNMKTRAIAMNGVFVITSKKNNGTVLKLQIPL
jgi:signal transduction histidine kinase